MLCPHCGTYAGENDILCPSCGALLDHGENQEEGVRSIRQGRRARHAAVSAQPKAASTGKAGASRIYVDPVARQDTREVPLFADPQVFNADGTPLATGYDRPASRGVYGDTTRQQTMMPSHHRKKHPLSKRMVNWTHVAIALVVLAVLMVIGVYLFLDQTDDGQKILARMGKDATAAAMWEVGQEVMDTGDIDRAITMFEAAREKDGEENINVGGLLTLGSAYEAAGRVDEAEALYREIYTDIVPSAPDAYRNVIRILLASERQAEAGELMQEAYKATGVNTFRQQRMELLPLAPTVNLTAGYYTEKKTITLASTQGYDVYYTFSDEAVLPDEGTLATEPIFLDEGIWNLRAVAVSGELVSDPLTASYKIFMPSPQTPGYSLAPGTYERRQRIWLRPGKENEKDDDITIYYTIDGSLPDADSPVWTGEPFYLPSGRVKLQAVAVNGYGKASNTLTVEYKFNFSPKPKDSYRVEDTANGLKLYSTTREEFQQAHGQGNGMEDAWLQGINEVCQKYNYNWGHATMAKTKSGWVLAELYFTTTQFVGPRSTSIGDSEEAVVSKFRDMGQVASPSGNRGLYDNDYGTGKVYQNADGTRLIRYVTYTADSHEWQLDYELNATGTVRAIRMLYIP
ncbi:MAG: tetratricopeptide repeat protein [Clostridiales bacterium]|nr:tetratricopeptide repeat protein [Clostridiales bacterium]